METDELRLQQALRFVDELQLRSEVEADIADVLEEENEELVNVVNTLQEKLNGLEVEKHDMEFENELLKTNISQYKDWNKVHYALYFFLFIYGMVYGVYFRTKQQEL